MRKSELGKTYFAKLAAGILLVAGLSISTAYAVNEIDLEQDCKLTLCIDETGAYATDLATVEIKADVYQVATVDSNGTYTALEGYGDLELENVSGQESSEDLFYWSETWNKKALAALEIAEKTTPLVTVTLQNNAGLAEGLDAGMYLVAVNDVKTTSSEYTFSPVLICLPTNPYLMKTSTDEADNMYWYEVTATLKPELDLAYGKLEIQKTLTSFNTSLKDVSFVFLIEAKDEMGNVVYSNVVSTTHNAAGTQSVIVDEIPAGLEITITEIYSGASYTVSGEDTKTAVVAVDEIVKVEFSNEYDDKLIPGYGVVNNFEYSEDEGWTWSQADGSDAENE